MKRITINEKEVSVLLAVLSELNQKPFAELNTFLGSMTIGEMMDLTIKLNSWYQKEVLGKHYDPELGWVF